MGVYSRPMRSNLGPPYELFVTLKTQLVVLKLATYCWLATVLRAWKCLHWCRDLWRYSVLQRVNQVDLLMQLLRPFTPPDPSGVTDSVTIRLVVPILNVAMAILESRIKFLL